jgi:phosphogluconate dehydratase
MVSLDCEAQTLMLEISQAELDARAPLAQMPDTTWGSGQGLFALFRRHAATAEEGASPLLSAMPD